jgi:hypothetical protein
MFGPFESGNDYNSDYDAIQYYPTYTI